jgi:hypothetical protein
MKDSSYILGQIRNRATVLRLLSAFKLSRSEAEKQAARELALERRAAQPSTASSITATTEITEANAREVLIRKVFEVAERMRLAPRRRNRLGPYQVDAQTIVKAHVEDPITTSPAPEAAPANEVTVVGVFAGRITAAEAIPDEFFHSSMHDRTTIQWRKSLRGGSTWIG